MDQSEALFLWHAGIAYFSLVWLMSTSMEEHWRSCGSGSLVEILWKRTTFKNWYEEKDLKPHTQKSSLLYLRYCQHCQSIPDKKVLLRFMPGVVIFWGTFLIICCTFHVFWIMSWERNVLKKNHCLIMAGVWEEKLSFLYKMTPLPASIAYRSHVIM